MFFLVLQAQADRKELIKRERRKLLALHALVMKSFKHETIKDKSDITVTAKIRMSKNTVHINIVKYSSNGKTKMLNAEKCIENSSPANRNDKNIFYNDIKHVIPKTRKNGLMDNKE